MPVALAMEDIQCSWEMKLLMVDGLPTRHINFELNLERVESSIFGAAVIRK